jgi:PAP2 superfamily
MVLGLLPGANDFRHRWPVAKLEKQEKRHRRLGASEQKKSKMKALSLMAAGLGLAALAGAIQARADVITDWVQIMLQVEHVENVSPLPGSRAATIVQASVFDAINGIERRFEPIHVAPEAPPGASRRAAAIQAAYTALVGLYADQQPQLDADLASSLASLTDSDEDEEGQSVSRGIAWGQSVAEAILAWRSTDGFSTPLPPFLGGTAVGEWRPTPPDFSPGAGRSFATMTPWVMTSFSQFRPAGPPSLTSAVYTADFMEVDAMGGAVSALRTPDESLAAEFWDSANGTYFWNSLAVRLAAERHTTLSENARLFAWMNLATADSRIACWDTKYAYLFWRPITAINLADIDGNPLTTVDPSWTTFLGYTPPFPEYPSGHATESSAATTVLAHFFGEDTHFYVDSDWMPGVTRSFTSFSAAVDEVKNARVWGGIHFRNSCNVGQATGQNVADFVLENAARPAHEAGGLGSLNYRGGPGAGGAAAQSGHVE